MLRPNADHIKRFCQLVEPAMEVVTKLHKVLDVKDLREEKLQRFGMAANQHRPLKHNWLGFLLSATARLLIALLLLKGWILDKRGAHLQQLEKLILIGGQRRAGQQL